MHAILSLLTFALAAGSAPKAVEAQPTIQFVYIGATNCGFCKKAVFKEKAAMIRDGARQWAKEHRFPFETIGVAVDADKSAGDRFLAESGVGPYDRTVSGLGREGADPFTKPYKLTNEFFSDGGPLDAIPQVAVFMRVTDEPTPREVLRAVGTIIQAYDRNDIITRSLDIIWKQKP